MLVSLGLDFRRADIELRERFHRTEEALLDVYPTSRRRAAGAEELVAVATCNRIELYAEVGEEADAAGDARGSLAGLWAAGPGPAREFRRAAVLRREIGAARHLLRLASGLESQVLGDVHILGQLRRSYRRAKEAEAVGGCLHRLFDTALRAGKRVRSETSLMAGYTSVGTEGARLALERTIVPRRSRFVVIGCGKTGEHAARAVAKAGVRELVLVNRTRSRAERLAAELGAGVVDFAHRHRAAARSDVALVATGAGSPILLADGLRRALASEGADGLLVMDLAMPRNVEPAVGRLPGVVRIDLDRLDPEAAAVEEARYESVDEAESIVEEELADYVSWRAESAAREALVPLRRMLSEVCERELAQADGERDPEVTASRIVAKVMARPMGAMRTARRDGASLDSLTGALGQLFGSPAESSCGSAGAQRQRERQGV